MPPLQPFAGRRPARRTAPLVVAALSILLGWVAPPAQATGNAFLVAGGGAGAVVDGQLATAPALTNPDHIALTPDGGFVFSDQNARQIRRVSPDGRITTIAGTGADCLPTTDPCGDGGGATAAKIAYPSALAVTPSGAVLFADSIANRIRLISSYVGGTITTVAGTGAKGFAGDGGAASGAQFDTPISLALLPDGGYVVGDTYNNRVRRVSAIQGGTITTIAGSGPTGCCQGEFGGDGGPATAARFKYIRGVAVTPDGGVLVGDSGNARIRKLSALEGGTVSTIAGDGTIGGLGDGLPAKSASLSIETVGLAVAPDGSILIATVNRVRRIHPQSGRITTVAGGGATALTNGLPATMLDTTVPPYGSGLAVTSDGGFFWSLRNQNKIVFVDTDFVAAPPTPGPTGPAGAAGAPGPAGSPGPAGKDGQWVSVSCTTPKAKGKAVPKPKCQVQTSAAGAKVTLSAVLKGKTVASATKTLGSTKASITLAPKKKLKKTTYKLVIVVEVSGSKVTTQQNVKLG